MNITKTVRDYVDRHVSTKDSLKKGIVNYSALARKIAYEKKIENKNFGAILVACRRYAEKLKQGEQEKKILAVLAKSKVQVKTKICRLILDKNYLVSVGLAKLAKVLKEKHLFQVIQGESAITVIIEEENLDKAEKIFKRNIIDIKKRLAEIIIINRPEADNVSGVTSYLSSLLSEKGINIISILGSYTDDIFILQNKDIYLALDIFNRF